MKFVQNFTPPDFQFKNFTLSISPNFKSFSKKKHKKWVKMEKFTPLATNFTLLLALTGWTNSTSAQTGLFTHWLLNCLFHRVWTSTLHYCALFVCYLDVGRSGLMVLMLIATATDSIILVITNEFLQSAPPNSIARSSHHTHTHQIRSVQCAQYVLRTKCTHYVLRI